MGGGGRLVISSGPDLPETSSEFKLQHPPWGHLRSFPRATLSRPGETPIDHLRMTESDPRKRDLDLLK